MPHQWAVYLVNANRISVPCIWMDFPASINMGTGGHYITMMLADWSISTSHDIFALSFYCENAMESTIGSVCPYVWLARHQPVKCTLNPDVSII